MSPRALLALALFLSCRFPTSGQTSIPCTADGYLIDHYGVEHGLSNPLVLDIAEDKHGFLWMATEDGLNRFDGQYFKSFHHNPNDPNTLAGNACLALLPDGNRLWVNTHEGINRYELDAGAWHLYDRAKGFPGPIEHLFKDRKGQIWACGSFGLVQYLPAQDSFARYLLPENWLNQPLTNEMRWIGEHPDGQLWVGTAAGILVFNPSKRAFTRYLFDPGKANLLDVQPGIFDPAGGFWFTGRGTGLNYFNPADGKTSTFFLSPAPDNRDRGSGILMPLPHEGDGYVWYLERDLGLFRFWIESRRFEPVLTPEAVGWQPTDQNFNKLFRDRFGVLWIGTTRGLLRLDLTQRHLRYFDLSKTLNMPARWGDISAIYQDPADAQRKTWWLDLSYNKGVVRYDARSHRLRYVPVHQAPGHKDFLGVHHFLRRESGGIWIGWRKGVYFFDDKTWSFQTPAMAGLSGKQMPAAPNYFLVMDKEHRLWTAERMRLYWLPKGEREFRLLYLDSLCNRPDAGKRLSGRLKGMSADQNGHQWFALGYARDRQPALLRFNPVTGNTALFYRTKTNEAGFPTNHDIFTVFADRQGRVWFGTEQGAAWFEPEAPRPRFHRFTRADGLPNDIVEFIAQSAGGDLLFGTRAGVTMVSPDLIKKVHLTLPYRVFDGATVPLWQALGPDSFACAYKKGFFLLDLSQWTWDTLPPKVFISNIRVDGAEWRPPGNRFPFTGTIRLSYRQTPVEFEFSAIQPHRSELNRIAWRMERLDNQWHTLENSRSAIFNNLPGGSYTLWVKACNHHGFWSEPVALRLRVQPPFWQTLWFAGLCALVFVLAVWGIFRFREVQRLRVEQVRQRIARDLHDDMGSTLSGISILSDAATQTLPGAEERRLFGSLGERTREVLEMMSDIVWSINPANDGFENLTARMRLFAFELCLARDIRLHFEAPEPAGKWRMTPDKRKDFYLIFKEALNNLAKYAGAKNAWVRIEKKGNLLILNITDDGRGFNPANVRPGNGLKNMAARAGKWSGTFQITAAEGSGVQIEVQLPLP